MKFYFRLVCAIALSTFVTSQDFIDDTKKLLPQGQDEGYIAAFGDFNADKNCDLFVISSDAKKLYVMLANGDKSYTKKVLLSVNDSVITSVMPADFDGDVQMDVLITVHVGDNKQLPLSMWIYWGNQKKQTVEEPLKLPQTVLDQPVLFDFNADMLPDLLAEEVAGERSVWLANTTRTFTLIKNALSHGTPSPFYWPHSNAFVDVNGDVTADLVITTKDGFEVWIDEEGVLTFNSSYPHPPHAAYIGQSSFADLDLDKYPEHILPVCADEKCSESHIYVRSFKDGKWRLVTSTMELEEKSWGFVQPGKDTSFTLPVSLKIADYNMDGYPDALAILQPVQDASAAAEGTAAQQAMLLSNQQCPTDAGCDGYARTFDLAHGVSVDAKESQVILGAFYDLYEDGNIDLILVNMEQKEGSGARQPHMVILHNNIASDTYFLKVTVVSGLCNTNCPDKRVPYGVNVYGPAISYQTIKADGKPQESAATQLKQSAHFALQLPYTIFGLGQMPNFIDHLKVGIPRAKHKPYRTRVWSTIIPNSQLIVIPYPIDSPSSWAMKLFVTPSHLVYLTGAALLGTCGFISIIAGILHWLEKREDKLEKKQEAQKFHFDAM